MSFSQTTSFPEPKRVESTLEGIDPARQGEADGAPTDEAQSPQRPQPSADAAPCVTIFLCTYNGERFLEDQLVSLQRQVHQNWRLVVSDDGSSDATLTMIERFAKQVPQPVEVHEGPRRGPAANFLALAADPKFEGDYFAFSDQDDVWHPDKLQRALQWLQPIAPDMPAAYGGRTRLVTAEGVAYGYAPLFPKRPTFGNALAQSIVGGNTMLFNRAAKRLLEEAGPLDIVSHDWWTYQLVCGNGGVLLYDEEPKIDYRQHGQNHIGGNRGMDAQMKRFRMALGGQFARWNDVNIAALEQCRPHLTEAARAELDAYTAMRSGSLFSRLRAFAGSNIRRQSLMGNVGLVGAIVLKKL